MVAELIDLDARRHGRSRHLVGDVVVDGFKFWRVGAFQWALDCVGRFPGGASDEDIAAVDVLVWGPARIPCKASVTDRRSDGRVVFRFVPVGFRGWLDFRAARLAVNRQQLLRAPTHVSVEAPVGPGTRRTWPLVFKKP